MTTYRNPPLTVDALIQMAAGLVLINRKNPPYGWALPGGFVDYGESLESAVCREAREETGLEIQLIEQFQAYSDPARDPRQHTVSVVFIARATGTPRAADDARQVTVAPLESLPAPLAFDHGRIISDYRRYLAGESRSQIFFGHPGAAQ